MSSNEEGNCEIDKLVHLMCTIDRQLERQIHYLRKECTLLQSLLNPWKPSCMADKADLADKAAEAAQAEALSVQVNSEMGELREARAEFQSEMTSIDKLLKKVKNVRTNVTDQEIKEMCQIKDLSLYERSDLERNLDKADPFNSTSKIVTTVNSSKRSKKTSHKGQIERKPNSTDNSSSFDHSQSKKCPSAVTSAKSKQRASTNLPRSSYQTSYKNPQRIGSGTARLFSDNSRTGPQMATEVSAKLSNESMTGYRLSSTALRQRKSEQVHGRAEVNEQDEYTFPLRNNGHSLVVPKAMSLLLKKMDVLKSKAHPQSAGPLPIPLEQYYRLCQPN